MRRILTLLFIAVLLLTPGYAPSAHAQPSAQVATTGTVIKTANLRAGPGTTFAIVGSAQAGQPVANVGDEPLTLYTHQVKGVDDSGRLFEEKDMKCLAANPGESTECVIVFEIEQANHIAALDVEVADHQQLAVPGVE